MTTKTRMPTTVAVGLVLAVALDTFIQLFWKMAVGGIPDNASMAATVAGALSHFYFYAAMSLFVVQLFNWTRVLANADLSFAQPFTALSYITVLSLSYHSLHERISPVKIAGVALIFLGVFFISRTPHSTGAAADAP